MSNYSEITTENTTCANAILTKGTEISSTAASNQKASDAFSKMQQDIIDLCKGLSKGTSDDEFDCEQWLEQLQKYVGNTHRRILYSNISNYIFEQSDSWESEGERDTTFLTNLESVMNYASSRMEQAKNESDLKQAEELYRIIIKIHDHVNLAQRQQDLMSQHAKDIDERIGARLTPQLSETVKNLTSQLVGLVAIFTALSFIVFGGITSLQSIFANVRLIKNSLLPVLIVAVAWAFCLLNLLFAFMYFVLKITNISKPINPNADNIVQRYPVIFLTNYILFVSFAVLCGLWFSEANGFGAGVLNGLKKEGVRDTVFIAGAIVILLVAIAIGFVLVFLYNAKPNKGKDNTKSGSKDDPKK